MASTRQKEYFSINYCFAGEEEKIPAALDLYAQKDTDLDDINRILELYNIKLFFDKYSSVNSWSKIEYEKYKGMAKSGVKEVKRFFDTINVDNIVCIYESCDVSFWDDFWKFFYQFAVYEKIPKERFNEIIEGLQMSPNELLENRAFVEMFDEQISDKLMKPDFGAAFLVDYYMSARSKQQKYYFPKSLSADDMYNTVLKYINEEQVNPNVLDLIINGRPKNGDFKVDDKLRCQAQKRYRKYWKDTEEISLKLNTEISVSFGPDLPDASIIFNKSSIKAEYNVKWINENLDYPTLLNNFIYLFKYCDLYMRCALIATSNERGIIEDLYSTNGNAMYKKGHAFELINNIADIQMLGYNYELIRNNVYIENVIKWFFEDYLKEEFGVNGFLCNVPSREAKLFERCKVLPSAIDGVVKQYRMYCEDGEIDRELYEMSSSKLVVTGLPSFIKYKYAYSNSRELTKEMHMLYSEKSMLSYIKKTESKYQTLYELLMHENVSINDFRGYQISKIEWLIERGSLKNENGVICINSLRACILEELYERNVICLQYIKNSELKRMIASAEVRVGSTLLSEPEADYFNYNLNRREFSNGLDLRNKYIHDTGSADEDRQRYDYCIMLKIMIILIIKINEEFCLRETIMNGETDFYEL